MPHSRALLVENNHRHGDNASDLLFDAGLLASPPGVHLHTQRVKGFGEVSARPIFHFHEIAEVRVDPVDLLGEQLAADGSSGNADTVVHHGSVDVVAKFAKNRSAVSGEAERPTPGEFEWDIGEHRIPVEKRLAVGLPCRFEWFADD